MKLLRLFVAFAALAAPFSAVAQTVAVSGNAPVVAVSATSPEGATTALAPVVYPLGGPAAAATAPSYATPMGCVYNTTAPTYTNAQLGQAQCGSRGSLAVQLMSANGTSAASLTGGASDANTGNNQGLNVAGYNLRWNGSTWDREGKPVSVSRLISSAASTNATVVKASAGNIHRVTVYNANAAARYLKFYNKATSPTVGTDTPVWTEYLPATTKTTFEFPNGGLYFATGIGFAVTTGSADSDTGAVTSGDILALNIAYN